MSVLLTSSDVKYLLELIQNRIGKGITRNSC